MVSRSVEQWRSLAAERILGLLDAEGAVTKPEMEAKLSERPLGSGGGSPPDLVNPHHLATARSRLLDAGEIRQSRDTARGGRTVATFTRADPTKAAGRVAGRKRLLHARFLSWSSSAEWKGAAPIPAGLERVIHRSLLDASPSGYRLARPEGGDVSVLLGSPVAGGSLDNAAFYTPLSEGMPGVPVTVIVEAKNLREWVYPSTQELYQVLDKGAALAVSNPGVPIVPVLVCRKMHFTTARMASQMGFHCIETKRQYVRPIVAAGPGETKFKEVVVELGYDLQLNEGSVAPMVQQFVTHLPRRIDEAAARWRQVVSHPVVPPALKALRDDRLRPPERRALTAELKEAVDEATGESPGWGPDHA